ncbi:unnamed protein product [Phaeothamnion confervicola]
MVHVGSIVVAIGMLLLLHAGHSTAHFRQFVVVAPGEGEARAADRPPLDAVVEAIGGFLISAIGVVWAAGKLHPIKGRGKGMDSAQARPDFDMFQTRARSLRMRLAAMGA